MKLLLTSSGICNASIQDALVELLGKPISECSALCIPTAIYPFQSGPAMAYKFITGRTSSPLCELDWKSLGVLELTALPSVKKENWVSVVQETDALLVFGGDVLYLRHWMRESGLADLFASMPEMVYVGISAGSMVVTSQIAETYTHSMPLGDDDIKLEEISLATAQGEPFKITLAVAPGLGQVDFALIPHVENERFPENSLASIEKWGSRVSVPLYAIDDQTAIKVADGNVEVISEGEWKLFTPLGDKF